MAKRKREDDGVSFQEPNGKVRKGERSANDQISSPEVSVQIITGSYERALHGITAMVPQKMLRQTGGKSKDASKDSVSFADTFLFNAHASAIRCLALSPPSSSPDSTSQKRILATGGTDERINLYHLSTAPPPTTKNAAVSPRSLAGNIVSQNARNRELGSLLHHSGSINALYFPSRSKLLSAASDNIIAVSRTRDWTVLSTIKAPIPKPQGRPSGDTLAPGEVPAGVNDIAVHPSMKVMVSIGRGEKCMRLWNLVTGKRAGVLNFERDILAQAGEGRYGTGEGRLVLWDREGEELVIGFERGAVVFGLDCIPKGRIAPKPPTKIHQLHYLPHPSTNVLAVSTEDGRILFYDTARTIEAVDDATSNRNAEGKTIPHCELLAQLGGLESGAITRIKDFEILQLQESPASFDTADDKQLLIVTGSSDGAVRLWSLDPSLLFSDSAVDETAANTKEHGKMNGVPSQVPEAKSDGEKKATPELPKSVMEVRQVGTLLGTCETGNRITCLKAFFLSGERLEDGNDDEADEGVEHEGSTSESDEE